MMIGLAWNVAIWEKTAAGPLRTARPLLAFANLLDPSRPAATFGKETEFDPRPSMEHAQSMPSKEETQRSPAPREDAQRLKERAEVAPL